MDELADPAAAAVHAGNAVVVPLRVSAASAD